jgi:hypothetical protein
MKILSEDEVAIRVATEKAVQAAGGQASIAAALETNTGKISRLSNISNDLNAQKERLYLKASEAVKIDALAGSPFILEAMAARLGFRVVRDDQSCTDTDLHKQIPTLIKEFGEALLEAAEAVNDGNASKADAKRVYDELQGAVDAAKAAQAVCISVMVGQAKPILKAV